MRALMLALGVVALAVVPGTIGFALGRRSQPSPETAKYHEHARLIEQAAKASRRGQDGLAEILAKAAENVLHEGPSERPDASKRSEP